MTRRAHLRQLARHLRRYLAWQKGQGTTSYVPADSEARKTLKARKKALQEQKLAELRAPTDEGSKESVERRPDRAAEPVSKPEPEPELPSPPAEFRKPEPTGPQKPETSKKAPSDGEVTASTPLWKKHDPIHEITGRRRKKADKAAAARKPTKQKKPPSKASPDGRPTPPLESTAGPSEPAGPPPAGPVGPSQAAPQTPAEKMEFLQNYLGECQRCALCEGRTNVVFGDGDPNARLLFVGEGPGRNEDRQGLPFVGPSGQLLTKMIAAMGFERGEVYITNIVKCRPPGNRNPAPLEIKECAPFLKKQIQVIEPEVIVTLGRFASNALLAKDEALGKLRGRWHEHMGAAVMPTYHPAYLLRNEDDRRFKRRVWSDLQMVMERLGRDSEEEQ